MGQNPTTRGPQVLVFGSLYQGKPFRIRIFDQPNVNCPGLCTSGPSRRGHLSLTLAFFFVSTRCSMLRKSVGLRNLQNVRRFGYWGFSFGFFWAEENMEWGSPDILKSSTFREHSETSDSRPHKYCTILRGCTAYIAVTWFVVWAGHTPGLITSGPGMSHNDWPLICQHPCYVVQITSVCINCILPNALMKCPA